MAVEHVVVVVLAVLAGVKAAETEPNNCIGPVKHKLLSIAPSRRELKAFLSKAVELTNMTEFIGADGFLDKPVDWKSYLGRSEACMSQNDYFMQFACQVYKDPKPFQFSTVSDKLLKEAMMLSVYLDRGTAWLVAHPHSLEHIISKAKTRRKGTKCETVLGHGPKGVFARAKIWAVDFALEGYAATLKDDSDVTAIGGWKVALNIYEAVVLDLVKKRKANAKAGSVLAAYTAGSKSEHAATGEGPSKWVGSPPVLSIRYPLGALWADLYQTWNLAFCYATYKAYPLLFAKLLIPSVSCYRDTDASFYLWNRGIALMLYINWVCLAMKERGDIISNWAMAKSAVISEHTIQSWGNANKASAKQYRKRMRQRKPSIYREVEKQLRKEWRNARRKVRRADISQHNALHQVAEHLDNLQHTFRQRVSGGKQAVLQPSKNDKERGVGKDRGVGQERGVGGRETIQDKTTKPTFSQRVRSLFAKKNK